MKPTPAGLAFLDAALERAREQHLLREPPARGETVAASFASNDYLGLASLGAPEAIAGAGASRLLGGDREVHRALEDEAAAWVGLPSARVFSSGYAANVGLLAALAGPGDLIVSDQLNHASIIDGARLSRARIEVTPHNDVDAVRSVLRAWKGGRAFVVTESYFSMDADSPDLAALRSVCDEHGAALVVDEAHALGVLGPEGGGLCRAAGIEPDALVGTFGKAFGAAGAFVAGCPALGLWLWNRARSFVFSTGTSPAATAAALQGLRVAAAEPARRERVLGLARQLREGLAAQDKRPIGHGHIVPWVLGDAATALRTATHLRSAGLDVLCVRPPTVPSGTARIRLTVTAAHASTDVERALATLARVSAP